MQAVSAGGEAQRRCGKRKNPGLRPQHLTTLNAARNLCDASIEGARIGSMEIKFIPGALKGGDYSIDIGTAGSLSLMLQCLSPITAFCPSEVRLSMKGGTCVRWSPPIPFTKHVILDAFKEMGLSQTLTVERHGFFPKGGGKVNFNSFPSKSLGPISLGDPSVSYVKGVSICGNLSSSIAERQARSATVELKKLGFESDIETQVVDTFSPGTTIVLWCEGACVFLGADYLGERGKPAEKVGAEAAKSLLSQISTGANVDRNTGDHLILPFSLADGTSVFKVSELTMHTHSAIELSKRFTGCEVDVNGKIGKPATIEIQGIGFEA